MKIILYGKFYSTILKRNPINKVIEKKTHSEEKHYNIDNLNILTQVHLRKPCYDFSFL